MFIIKVFALIISSHYILSTPIDNVSTPPQLPSPSASPTAGGSLQLGTPGGQLSLGIPPLGAQGPSPQLTPANIPTLPITLPLPQIHTQLPMTQLNLGPLSIAAGTTIGLNIDQSKFIIFFCFF